MQDQKLRLEAELPHAQYALVQLVKQRLGFIASASLTCFFFGETPRLMGISANEADVIGNYASELGVAMCRISDGYRAVA